MEALPIALGTCSLPSSIFLPTPSFKWGVQRIQDTSVTNLVTRRRNAHVFRVSVSSGKVNGKDNAVMVDPLEAKRLAAKQMQEIRRREKLKKRRQIEAINGASAMIGLTAGLVIEGYTGNSILDQLAGYWSAFTSFFAR